MTMRECKVVIPSVQTVDTGLQGALEIAKSIRERLVSISGGFTVAEALGNYKSESETVVIAFVAVKDDEERFGLLDFAHWLKRTLNQESIYVVWDDGVVQLVGDPDDDVRHDWALKTSEGVGPYPELDA